MDNMKEECDGRWKTRKRRCCCNVGRWETRKRRCCCDVGRWKMRKRRCCCDVGRCKTRKWRCCCNVWRCCCNVWRCCCDVGRWKMRKRSCRRTSPTLPHEVIENILSRLPVKDLLRFSVVCKQWEATISDPTFAQIHLHQYSKNPSSPNLLGWDNLENLFGRDYGFNGLHVVELRNNCIELVSTIEHSRKYGLQYFKSTWCSFDGLYLMCLSHRVTVKPIKLVLWNPSRRMYRELYFPHSDLVSNTTICSMYYNPLMKDYRIVIGDLDDYDVYAVYSCRDDEWCDVKEMKGFLGGLYLDTRCSSVSVNGSIYWLVLDSLDLEDDVLLVYREVLCFDCKDETFRRLPLPYYKDLDEKYFQLTSFGDQLCLLVSNRERDTRQVEIMIKVNSADEWMELEFKEECCLYDCGPPEPMCQLSDNEILLCKWGGYKVYDKTKNTLVKILNNYPHTKTELPIYLPISKQVEKHVENLLLL